MPAAKRPREAIVDVKPRKVVKTSSPTSEKNGLPNHETTIPSDKEFFDLSESLIQKLFSQETIAKVWAVAERGLRQVRLPVK